MDVSDAVSRGSELFKTLYLSQSPDAKLRIDTAVNDYFEKFEQFEENLPKTLDDFNSYTYDFSEHIVKPWPIDNTTHACPLKQTIQRAKIDQLVWRCCEVVNKIFPNPNDREDVKAFIHSKVLNGVSNQQFIEIGQDSFIEDLKNNAHNFMRCTQTCSIAYRLPNAELGQDALLRLQQTQDGPRRIDAAIRGYREGFSHFLQGSRTPDHIYHFYTNQWRPQKNNINNTYYTSDRNLAMWAHHYWLMDIVLNSLFPNIQEKLNVYEYLTQTHFKKSPNKLLEEWKRNLTSFMEVANPLLKMLDLLRATPTTGSSSGSTPSADPPSAPASTAPATPSPTSTSPPPPPSPSTATAQIPPPALLEAPPKPIPAPKKDEKPFALWKFLVAIGDWIASGCSWLWSKMPWVKRKINE